MQNNMARRRFRVRYNRPQHPGGAWLLLAIGVLFGAIGMFNFDEMPRKQWPIFIFTLGCALANFAAMYLFPWYATKHVIDDWWREREDEQAERAE